MLVLLFLFCYVFPSYSAQVKSYLNYFVFLGFVNGLLNTNSITYLLLFSLLVFVSWQIPHIHHHLLSSKHWKYSYDENRNKG